MSNPPKSEGVELMTAYVDGELDPTEAEELESYLADSPEAKAELDELRQVVHLVGKLPTVEAPGDFYDKISRRLKRRQLLRGDSVIFNLISLPFQVLSILVILAVAALYMLAQLEQAPQGEALEPDPGVERGPESAAEGPRPIRP